MCRVLVNFSFGDNSREHPGDPRASLVWQLGPLGAADVLIRSFLSSDTHTHLCTHTAIVVRTLVNMMHSYIEPLSLTLATSHLHPYANRETNS